MVIFVSKWLAATKSPPGILYEIMALIIPPLYHSLLVSLATGHKPETTVPGAIISIISIAVIVNRSKIPAYVLKG
ncbi:MAG: hypothetical protein Fur0016_10290 [Anaerolineales bacterium]